MRINFLDAVSDKKKSNKKLTIRERKKRDKLKNDRRKKEQADTRMAEKELDVWMKMAYAAEIHRLQVEEAASVEAWVRGFFMD